jgi:hypothetical protein
MKSLQNKYNLIKEGKGNKELFLKEAKSMFPNIVTNVLTYDQAIHNLVERGVITENQNTSVNTKAEEPNWFKVFNENMESLKEDIKVGDKLKHKSTGAEFKITKISGNNITGKYTKLGDMEGKVKIGDTNKTSKNLIGKTYELIAEAVDVKATLKQTDKSVEEKEIAGYDYKDKKNNNNISTAEILTGYYVEMKDPKNADKTETEIKTMVFKNLEKDPLHYVKTGQFGVKDLGYIDEAPGLGKTKEVTGKYKSSGMEPVKLSESKHSDEASLGIYKSELNLINRVKPKGEKYEKRKAELEKKIADLESKLKEVNEIGMFHDPIGYDKNKKSQIETALEILTGAGVSEEEVEKFISNNLFKKGALSDRAQAYVDARNSGKVGDEMLETDITGIAGSEDEEDYKKGAKGVRKENTQGLQEYNGYGQEVSFYYQFEEIEYKGEMYNVQATITAEVEDGDMTGSHPDDPSTATDKTVTWQVEEIHDVEKYDPATQEYEPASLSFVDKLALKKLLETTVQFKDEIVDTALDMYFNSEDADLTEAEGDKEVKKKLMPNKQKGIADSIEIKSTLEKIAPDVWKETDLEKAKQIVYSYLEASDVNATSKQQMVANVKEIVKKSKLDYYIANALLKYEKLGVNEEMANTNITTLSEAKKRAIEKHLKEIEKLGEIAAVDHKIQKIQEKIDELKSKITMTESDGFAEMVDKAAVKELKKDIALLERRKKMSEAQKAKLAKKVSGQGKPQTHAGGGVMTGMTESKDENEMFLDAVFDTLNDKMRANELSNQEFNNAVKYLDKHGRRLSQTSDEPGDVAELIIRKVTGMTESKPLNLREMIKNVINTKRAAKTAPTSIKESKLRSLINQIIKEELNEYGADSGGQDMTWGMYGRSISKTNKGNKDFIEKGYYDYYDDIPFDKPAYEFGKNKYYGGADLAKLWQLGWKKAEAKDKGIEMEDNYYEPEIDDQSRDYDEANLSEGKDGMDFPDAKKLAYSISREGVVQHVNELPDGSYEVSDWYDSDSTVISYENGIEL